MKIYKMKITTKKETFLGNYDSDKVYWLLHPKETAEVVQSEDDCKFYNQLYAIEYDTDKMSIKYLLEIMYENMSIEEIKTICKEDTKLEQFFIAYLSGENIRKDLALIKESASSASSSAGAALAVSLLK